MIALDWLRDRLAMRLGFVHFMGGLLFAGLHEFEVADDGVSYWSTAHCMSECHQSH